MDSCYQSPTTLEHFTGDSGRELEFHASDAAAKPHFSLRPLVSLSGTITASKHPDAIYMSIAEQQKGLDVAASDASAKRHLSPRPCRARYPPTPTIPAPLSPQRRPRPSVHGTDPAIAPTAAGTPKSRLAPPGGRRKALCGHERPSKARACLHNCAWLVCLQGRPYRRQVRAEPGNPRHQMPARQKRPGNGPGFVRRRPARAAASGPAGRCADAGLAAGPSGSSSDASSDGGAQPLVPKAPPHRRVVLKGGVWPGVGRGWGA